MPSWKKVILSGSNAALNTLTVSNGITGSLLGTATTASYVAAPGATTQVVFNSLGALSASSGFVFNAGNVGIGTTSPASMLDISGVGNTFTRYTNTTNAGQFIDVGSNSAAQHFIFGYGAYPMLFGTNGSEVIRITSGGSVGIGETSPSARLEVKGAGATSATTAFRVENSSAATSMVVLDDGNVGIGTTSPGEKLVVSNAGAAGFEWVPTTGRWYRYNRATSAYAGIYTEASEHTWAIGSSEAMRINASSNVGIGTNNPTLAKLQVQGNVSASSYTGSLFGTASFATNATSASFASTASYVLNAISASFATSASVSVSSSYAAAAQLATTASFVQTAQTASYVLNAVSASFATSASVARSASFAQTAQSATSASFASTAQTATTASYVLQAVSASFATSASSVVSASFASTAQTATTASYVLNAVSASFVTSASFATTASFVSTASFALSVVSASFAATSSRATSASFATNAVNAVNAENAYVEENDIDGAYYLVLANTTANYIRLSADKDNANYNPSTGTLTVIQLIETSARRFKENIEPLKGSLERVQQLQGVSFNRVGDTDKKIGFIAEDVAEVYPELVEYNKEGEVQGLAYQRTVAVLVEAVKELTDKLQTQEIFIKDLESRIKNLETN